MLCATLKSYNEETFVSSLIQADMLEFRLDLSSFRNLKELRKRCTKPVIFKLKEPNFDIFSLLPDYVDLPSSTPKKVFREIKERFPSIKRICSYHNFRQTNDLQKIYQQISKFPAEHYKIACFAHSTAEALKMLKLVKQTGCLGISMGEHGQITRILAPIFGAPWTYAPAVLEEITAPGQLLLSELLGIYHFRDLNTSTGIYGLIGDPVVDSHSHKIHNFAFKQLNLDAVYVKMRVQRKELNSFFALCQELGFKGVSVTMPLKQAVVSYAVTQEEAVNTLKFGEKVLGWNTDGAGALDALEKIERVKGKRVVLLGAGGAAIGIAKEAKKRGANLVILNRTFSKAEALAKQVGGVAGLFEDFAKICQEGYAVLVNATSCGMQATEKFPISLKLLLEGKIVMDIVNKREKTLFIRAAEAKKCCIVEGHQMWTLQAVGQYEHWFQHEPLEG